MSFSTTSIATSATFPQEPGALSNRLSTMYGDIAYSLNSKEVGLYDTSEIASVQQWLINTQGQRIGAYRKVLQGTLVGSGTTTIAHGLTPTGYVFTRIYGTVGNASSLFAPLPQSGTDEVSVIVNATNVVLTAATATYDGFSVLIVLEYLKTV